MITLCERALKYVKILGRYLSCAARTAKGKDYELILAVTMKTTHPIDGQFGCEFPVICNH